MTLKILYTSLVLFIGCVTHSIYFPEHIYGATLQWQSNEEDDLAGYYIYCASSQLDHDLIVNVGNVTEYDLNELTLYENVAYVIVLTSYDLSGNESDFSDPLYFVLDDEIDDSEDNCPDIYNPNQEDSNGNGIGDVCETTLATSTSTIPVLPPASTTTIPPANTTTTIAECELDSDCRNDGLYCNGDEFCNEGTCVSAGNPCAEDLICDEATDECKTVIPPGTLQFTLDAWYQSRWVSRVVFLSIEGLGTHFDRAITEITLNPSYAVIMLFAVIDETTIECVGILMPRWWAPVDSIDITVSTGAEVATAKMGINLLPLLLEQEKNTWFQE
jgi:hypothetical protein